MTSLSASAVSRTSVAPVARQRHDRVLVRILAGEPRIVRPEDPQLELSELEHLARVDDDDRDAEAACGGEHRFSVGRRRLDPGLGNRTDVQPVDDPRRAADVVSLRMREDDRGQRPHAETLKLAGHVRLRRPLVHEHGGTRRLDEGGIALTDVEKRDAETGRRRPGRRRAERARDRRDGQCERHECCDGLATPVPRQPPDEDDRPDEQGGDHDGRRRRDLRRRPARDDPRDEREPPGAPTGEPRRARSPRPAARARRRQQRGTTRSAAASPARPRCSRAPSRARPARSGATRSAP